MEKAIKLAIEKGGWDWKQLTKLNWYIGIAEDGGQMLFIKSDVGRQAFPLASITIQPTFWQALGKALGWQLVDGNPFKAKHPSNCNCGRTSCEMVEMSYERPDWLNNAHRFFELKLTGGDEEKFWSDLLNNK